MFEDAKYFFFFFFVFDAIAYSYSSIYAMCLDHMNNPGIEFFPYVSKLAWFMRKNKVRFLLSTYFSC